MYIHIHAIYRFNGVSYRDVHQSTSQYQTEKRKHNKKSFAGQGSFLLEHKVSWTLFCSRAPSRGGIVVPSKKAGRTVLPCLAPEVGREAARSY